MIQLMSVKLDTRCAHYACSLLILFLSTAFICHASMYNCAYVLCDVGQMNLVLGH